MNDNLNINDVSKIMAAIRDELSQAYSYSDSGWAIQGAYVRMRVLLEALGLQEALRVVQQLEAEAAKNWGETAFDEDTGDTYLVWAARLFQYLSALEATLGEPATTTVTKDVVQLLRAAQYFITDKDCFPNPPATEDEVHIRIEALLRCVFPDLLHKPPIPKQIKNFQADTGLPSVGTLIEYKFMANLGDERRIADEILADTRGYVSDKWKKYVYVIYETKRIKPESQWRQLLQGSGLKSDTEVVVISGEEPPQRRNARRRGA